MLATQERRGQVGREHPVPRLLGHVERGVVVAIVEPRVVDQHVDPTELSVDPGEGLLDLDLHRQVGTQRQLSHRMLPLIDADHGSALVPKPVGHGLTDHPRCTGDHAYLAGEPGHPFTARRRVGR
jgi:hypothetical protein